MGFYLGTIATPELYIIHRGLLVVKERQLCDVLEWALSTNIEKSAFCRLKGSGWFKKPLSMASK